MTPLTECCGARIVIQEWQAINVPNKRFYYYECRNCGAEVTNKGQKISELYRKKRK